MTTRAANSIRTMADLLFAVDDLDLPLQVIRVLRANIRTTGVVAVAAKARKDGRSIDLVRDDALLATVPVDPAWLNEHLWAYPSALCGTKEPCRALSISGTRRVMRAFDLLDPHTNSKTIPTGSKWRQLLDRLEHTYAETALASFAAWAHREGVEPEDVSQQHIAAFERWVRTRTLHKEIARLVRNVCKAWSKAEILLPGSDHTPLTPPVRRNTSTLPWTEFSPALLAEVEKFQRWYSGVDRKGPFRGDGRRRRPRARTIQVRRYSLLQALSAVVVLGLKTTETIKLEDLANPTIFEAVLNFYWERAVAKRTEEDIQQVAIENPSLGVTAQTGAIAATLMILARYLRVRGDALEALREMAQDLTPEVQSQLSRKNRERLWQFDNLVTRAKLLHLPRRIKELIETGSYRSLEAARMARTAAAIEFLLHIPIRNGNLCMLRLGTHLRYDGSPLGYVRRLVLQRHETKNSYEGVWPIGEDLGRVLDWYIKGYRPLLAADGNDCLFPAGFDQPGSLSNCAMYQNIVRTVAHLVGAELNPHLFRCICAYLILEKAPEALEDVRLMIGDKSLVIVLRHYAASQPRHVVERWDNLLRDLRHNSKHLVAELQKLHALRSRADRPNTLPAQRGRRSR